jgi:hypothetical protein
VWVGVDAEQVISLKTPWRFADRVVDLRVFDVAASDAPMAECSGSPAMIEEPAAQPLPCGRLVKVTQLDCLSIGVVELVYGAAQLV